MPLLSGEVYEALREIGVSDAQALRTAAALALPNKELADVRTDLAVLKTMVEQLQHRVNLLMTLMLVVLGGVLSTLWVLARH
jgi:ubiquinone biosynthesis protein UbiJ